MDLNSQLLPNDSPMALNQGQTGSFKFDYENEAGIVSTAKIRNAAIDSAKIQDAAITNAKIGTAAIGTANIGTLTFNEISGGTATLGGTSNGNGLLTVKNSGGTEVVRVDNTGITVNGGSITIVNATGGTIVDQIGLVSTVNFSHGNILDIGVYTTNNTNYIDLGTTTMSITLSRTTNIFFSMIIAALNQGYWDHGYVVWVELWDNTTSSQISEFYAQGIPFTGGALTTQEVSYSWISALAAGTHSIKLRYKTSDGSGIAQVNSAGWIYMLLGQ